MANKDKEYYKKHNEAANSTDTERLTELSKDEDWNVRYWVADNPNTPVEILTELSKDENEDVSKNAIRHLNIKYIGYGSQAADIKTANMMDSVYLDNDMYTTFKHSDDDQPVGFIIELPSKENNNILAVQLYDVRGENDDQKRT